MKYVLKKTWFVPDPLAAGMVKQKSYYKNADTNTMEFDDAMRFDDPFDAAAVNNGDFELISVVK